MPRPSPSGTTPRTHLLSNGRYSVMLTAAGSGYSQWRGIAITRWREDPTCDPWGSYLFLKDVHSGEVWSAGYQPSGREPDDYEAAFFEDRAHINRRDGTMRTRLEIVVSGDEDAEARRISLTNEGNSPREIELTSYCEVVLSAPAADSAHPAFSKMFVQTEFVAAQSALLATRRPRDAQEAPLWMVHFSVLEGEGIGEPQFETDRARFLGRGRDLRNAVSILTPVGLSGTAGTVLDPVMALRRCVKIPPGDTAHLTYWTGVASGRAEALSLAARLDSAAAFRQTELQCAQKAQAQLLALGIESAEAQLFQDIAGLLLYAGASLRAAPGILAKNELGQSTLWSHGISGDRPIVLIIVEDLAALDEVRQLLLAQAYWQTKGLSADLVVLDDSSAADAALVHTALQAATAGHGSVTLVRADTLPPAHRDLLETAARAVFSARRGPLSTQLPPRPAEPMPLRRPRPSEAPPRSPPAAPAPGSSPGLTLGNAAAAEDKPGSTPAAPPPQGLAFFNGIGGFDEASREYAMVLGPGQWTPVPWVNVIANPQFGFLISADGTGSTWSLNAQQNQITPWCNDPVSNTPAECFYIRDELSGDLWSAMPLPIRDPTAVYQVRHGLGYTRCEHVSRGIAVDLLQYVPREDPVKISRLKILNRSAGQRRLSITHYVDWMLGNQNNRSAPFIVTQTDAGSGALLARNPWTADFRGRVAIMDMGGRQQSLCADRGEFIGRYGSLAEPEALLAGAPLSMRVGGGLDPCGALQTAIVLAPGESTELTLLLGEESSSEAAVALIERYRTLDLDAVLAEVTGYWERTLDTLKVRTPDRSMDLMLNGWLLYQTLSSRVWGRTAFYQSSGAYGFRDQLQDVMSLCLCAPSVAREHLLRAAARQFTEGDVQHWWLPTSGQGIKTRVADDRIWLAFVLAHYLEVTADFAVLDEPVAFLGGGPLGPDALENFSAPATAGSAALFEHCVRALDSSMTVGGHGLPLFGTGDWNDGMNRVGIAGRGESVWMGWFLHATLLRFAPIAERRGDTLKAGQWRKHADALKLAIEREAWDGEWYRRGYYDDGTALGSAASEECRIDSIAQSWAVISGAAERGRSSRAMAAVDRFLVNRDARIVQLFTPPFDRTAHDPGYIKAYPPGLRENGGQYTHAATWSVLAFALLGDGDRAHELFSFLNPITHSAAPAAVARYKVEPYVVCADVYSAPQHLGRGGWTWYTGSAAWLYRSGIEGILGIHVRGESLFIDPCIPRGWDGFEFTYRHGTAWYRIVVNNPLGVCRGIVRASLDGAELPGPEYRIALLDDGRRHEAWVVLG